MYCKTAPRKGKYIFYAFIINFAIAFISIIGFLIRDNGLFTLCNDFNKQQIPICMLANESIKNGNVLWNWSIDLGSDFMGSTAFYPLGSPFFWLTFIFPANAYIYLAGWLLMLKYAIAGVTSYAYLARFTKDNKYALIGSVLYAFSGFQTVNLLFPFHDAVALFPLMLIGVEKAAERKKGYLIAAVVLTSITNYYCFVMEVIFVVIYYLLRFGIKNWKNILQCMIEGILGIGVGSFFLVPAFSLLLSNPRIGNMIEPANWFDFGRRHIIQLLRVFLFPADAMGNQSCVYTGDWSSWSAYLPMIGITLTLAYIIKKKTDWICRLLVFLFICCYIPLFNSIFNLFSIPDYHRWYFMLVLIMCLASVKVMEDSSQYPVRIFSALLLLFNIIFTILLPWWHEHKFEIVFIKRDYLILSVIGITGVGVTLVIFLFKNRKNSYFISLLVSVSVFAIGTTVYMCNTYQKYSDTTAQDYYDSIQLLQKIQTPDNRYRFNTDSNIATMTVPLNGTGSFYSTLIGSVFEFWNALGEERSVFSPHGPEGTENLLSAKYEIDDLLRSDETPVQQIEYNGKMLYVYENDNILPLGFTQHTYLLQSEFETISKENRALIMLHTLVIPDTDEETVAGYLTHLTDFHPMTSDEETALHIAESSTAFLIDSNGFFSHIHCEEKGYAFFSVPFSHNWRAKVNAGNVEIINTNGMMAVPVEAGENEIIFTYQNTELLFGSIISFIFLALSILYMKFPHRQKQTLRLQ